MKTKILIIGGIWLAIGAYYGWKRYQKGQSDNALSPGSAPTTSSILGTVLAGPINFIGGA